MTYPRPAAELLAEVATVRRRSRAALDRPWVPLLWFGAATAASAALIALVGLVALIPFWLLVGAAGWVGLRRHAGARARVTGVSAPRRRWLTAAVMFALCLVVAVVAGMVGGRPAALGAPMIAVAVGYAVLGRLARDPVPALAVLPPTALGLALVALHRPPWSVELIYGLGLVLVALGLAVAGRSRR